jgi:hypothetical protein
MCLAKQNASTETPVWGKDVPCKGCELIRRRRAFLARHERANYNEHPFDVSVACQSCVGCDSVPFSTRHCQANRLVAPVGRAAIQ